MTNTRTHTFSAGTDGHGWMTQLQEMYDRGTFGFLAERGITEGWRCLEVGAGGGSVARWMCDRVGPNGHVVATDTNVTMLARLTEPNLEVREHDVDKDPVETGHYDLVHARLVLEHLPEPEVTLAKLVTAVRPGGWLVVEDMDWGGVHAATERGAEVFELVSAVMRDSWRKGGYHATFGARLPGLLRDNGLVDIDCEGRCRLIQGGTPRAQAFMGNILRSFGPWYVREGLLTEKELYEGLEWVKDPECAGFTATVVSAWGRLPE